jgi:hypothetical protein
MGSNRSDGFFVMSSLSFIHKTFRIDRKYFLKQLRVDLVGLDTRNGPGFGGGYLCTSFPVFFFGVATKATRRYPTLSFGRSYLWCRLLLRWLSKEEGNKSLECHTCEHVPDINSKYDAPSQPG